MRQRHRWLGITASLTMLLGALTAPARSNDDMFPPAPAARSAINFDGRGFLIHGKRTFLVSGSLHFARLPRAQWREILLKFKRAGYNTVQTYVFWNWQEPREGQWDFAGSHDLNGFLKLVKQMGMYATVRVGPYCCAEWDSGGYPVWLRFKPGLLVRQDDPAFMAEATKWYDKILPIVAANQINHGGSVILVQMENEDADAWGTEMPNSYFRKLHDIALRDGIQVPFFFSGLHHAFDPAGDTPWDSAGRTSPWYSTEFWAGWIGRYGPSDPGQLLSIVRGDWKIQAYGGNGYNHYMLYGGTNFGSYNNDEDAASYDYGAAISQGGALRTLYYQDKRAALFATSFPEILEDSRNATTQYAGAATGAGVRVTARRSPAGTILYLDNNSGVPVPTQVKGASGTLYPTSGPLTLGPGEIMPVVLDAPIAPDVTLSIGAARILDVAHQGQTVTVITYGDAGSLGQMVFRAGAKVINMAYTFPATAPQVHQFTAGAATVRVLALSPALADRTWCVGAGGQHAIVIGPEYVGRTAAVRGRLMMNVRSAFHPVLDDPSGGRVWVFGMGVKPTQAQLTPARVSTPYTQPTHWEMHTGDAEATPGFSDASWLAGTTPPQMGADGDPGAYAWYRTTVTAPTTGLYTLHFSDVGDWLRVFVDGNPGPESDVKERDASPVPRDLLVTLTAGRHTLAVLTAQYGRDKLYDYYGPINQIAAKGLNGPVTLQQGDARPVGRPITAWRVRLDPQGHSDSATEAAPALDTDGAGWGDAAIGQDVFSSLPGLAWFRADLGSGDEPHHTLHFESVDDNGTVFLNGTRLTHHEGWNSAFDVSLDSAWNPGGPNIVAVLVNNTSGAGGLDKPVTLMTQAVGEGTPLTGWRMRGGVSGMDAPGWQPLSATAPGVPTFYRAAFQYGVGSVGPHPVLRATFAGLSRGFLYLNGHNLGRYPEKSPTDSLYLPSAFLKPGTNTLSVFDEDGQRPSQIAIVPDSEASYTASVLAVGPVTPPHRHTAIWRSPTRRRPTKTRVAPPA